MSQTRMNRRQRRAFTLVELLVVIGIIALLISILLPVMNKAREQARNTVCMSNEKQLLAAFLMYVADNKGATPYFPGVGWYYPTGGSTAFQRSTAYFMDSTTPGRGGAIRYDVGVFWPYVANGLRYNATPTANPGVSSDILKRVMTCPSDLGDELVAGLGKIDMAASIHRNFSYTWSASFWPGDPNNLANDPPNLWRPRDTHCVTKIIQIPHSSYKIILYEEAHPNDGMCFMGWPNANGDDTPCFRHTLRANYGFADGHVDTYSPEELGYTKVQNLGDIATPNDRTLNARYFHLESDMY